MKVGVASKNPVKVEAVQKVFGEFFPETEIVSSVVRAGTLPPQPKGLEEIHHCALTRANMSLSGCAVGIGIESGVVQLGTELGILDSVVLADSYGKHNASTTPFIVLPQPVAELVELGWEVGPAVDRVYGVVDSKQCGSIVSILTGGKYTRRSLYETALELALHPRLSATEFLVMPQRMSA